MANIEEIENWEEGIYQLETTDPVVGGADGVDNTPHKNLANRTLWLKALLDKIALPGGVIIRPTVTVPDGYFECDGSELSRTVYAELFAEIGTFFGSGDGSTTFNLPDWRGEFLRGFDNGRGVDVGRVIGSAQGDAIRNITGSAGNNTLVSYNDGFTVDSVSGAFTVSSIYKASSNETISGSGADSTFTFGFNASKVVPTANENRPRNIAVMFCMKY